MIGSPADWSERLSNAEQYGFDRVETLKKFNYEIPPDSLHKITLRCQCGVLFTISSGNFYCKYVVLNKIYMCRHCSALRRESNNYSRYNVNWEIRCNNVLGYNKDETQKRFGYEYPKRSLDSVCVHCRDCNGIFEQVIADISRDRVKDIQYRCKMCAAKDGFYARKDKMHKNLKEFWSKSENRFWASDLAKSQRERRSKNMTELNKDPNFLERRIEGYNNSSSSFYKDPSEGEKTLREFIVSLGFDGKKKVYGVTSQQLGSLHDAGKRTTFEVDILVEQEGIGVEHNGVFWHSDANPARPYKPYDHYNKWLFFNKFHNIKLIQIWEHEWLLRREQVKNRLRSLLKKNTNVIYARKCTVEIVEKREALEFINREHIQLCPPALFKVAFGLRHEGALIAVAVFGRHHRNNTETVMQRFACLGGVTVAGGLSRLVSHAYAALKCPIYTWCDLRWSDGNGYERTGWTRISQTPPDYFYANRQYQIFSKQSRRKSVVKTPDGMTESQHARIDNLYKLYDCGKIKYVYNPATKSS